MRVYKRYHTNVKILFALGIESQILPKEFLATIPVTSSNEWKKKDIQYYGAEFEEISRHSLEELQLIADMRLLKMKQIFVVSCRLYLMIIQLFGEHKFQKIIRRNYLVLVPFIQNLIDVTGDKKIILRLLKVSSHQFGQWQRMKKYECRESLIWLCFKRIPRQISMREIQQMKMLLKDKKYLHWSSSSVWGKAVKGNIVSMSRQSWYHYAKLLGISKLRKRFVTKRKRVSVKANTPNEIWHMDITRYKTIDNKIMFVYTVMDNFSRKIVAWSVSEKLSGKLRLKWKKRTN